MKTIRNTVRFGVVALVVAFVSAFFGAAAQAVGTNSLTLHIYADHPTPQSYVAWQLTDTTTSVDTLLHQLAPLPDTELTAISGVRVSSTPVDAHGDARLTGLADGRYYLRAALPDGTSTTTIVAPVILDLPQLEADGTITRNVTVYPKSVEPPPPSPPGGIPTGGTPTHGVPTDGARTGGERFVKVNPEGKGLKGATFNVMTKSDGDDYTRVVSNGQPLVVGSDANGRFSVSGLDYGSYYLVEASAPTGYQLLTAPIHFTVDASSYDDAAVIQIVNTALPPGKIPKTGDLSLLLSLAVGVILIGMGIYLTRKPRRSSEV